MSGTKFTENDHARSRGVDSGSFIEELGGRPGIADPDSRISSDPECDDIRVVLLRDFLEIDPWLGIRQQVSVSYDRQWEWSRWLS